MVPVYHPDKVIGGINDFKSIRFIRMTFTDFHQPIICRFATFDLVRGEWRRYNFDLSDPDYCKCPLPVTAVIPDVILSQPKIL